MHKHSLKLLTVLLAGLVGASACTGDKGDPGPEGPPGVGEASISAILPYQVFQGRKKEIQIIGSGTAWDDTTPVDFGPGVTLKSKTVASPSSIIASVEIADDAEESVRDVKVGDQTYAKTFSVSAAIKYEAEIPVEQGGYVLTHVTMQDPDTPFVNPAFPAIDGLSFTTLNATATVIDAYLQADVKFAPGKLDLTIRDSGVVSTAKGAIEITARDPKPLAEGAAVDALIDSGSATQLFTFTPASATTTVIQIGLADPNGAAAGLLLPASGAYADALVGGAGSITYVSTAADPLYLVVFDAAGDVPSPYTAKVSLSHLTPTLGSEHEPNDDAATATPLTAPALVQGADLASGADYYLVHVTGASAATPKTIAAQVLGDQYTDTALAIFDAAMTSLNDSDQFDGFFSVGYESVSAKVTTDGDYYVVVSQGAVFDASSSDYDLLVDVK